MCCLTLLTLLYGQVIEYSEKTKAFNSSDIFLAYVLWTVHQPAQGRGELRSRRSLLERCLLSKNDVV